MTDVGVYQILFYFLVILALTKPVGVFMARVFAGRADVSASGSASAGAAHLPPERRPGRRRAALDRSTPARCWRSALPSSCSRT